MGRHHARLCAGTEGTELVAVVDASAERRDAIIEQFGGTGHGTVDSMLAQGVDVAIVATPTVTHRAIVERLLAAGVLCLVE
jgi:predicted dehydrogenase